MHRDVQLLSVGFDGKCLFWNGRDFGTEHGHLRRWFRGLDCVALSA